MAGRIWSVVLVVGVAACAADSPSSSDDETETATETDGADAVELAGMCSATGDTPGSVLWSRVLGSASIAQTIDVAVDRDGDATVAQGELDSPVGFGTMTFSRNGALKHTFPYGSVVAADPRGGTYVAGTFAEPIWIGGHRLVPHGAVDVFLVELDRQGHAVFARALGLAGDDGVQSIAVSRDERIALSSPSFGTVVLDRDCHHELELPFSGYLAFERRDELIVGGTFATIDFGDGTITSAGAMDGFVVAVDPSGCTKWHEIFSSPVATGTVAVTAVAVDAHDAIVLGGVFDPSIDLFGTIYEIESSPESGIVKDTFLVKLDTHGHPIWKQPESNYPARELNAIATDRKRNILVSGANAGNAGFFRITELAKLDRDGNSVWSDDMLPASGYGEGLGVAADRCGDAYWGVTALDTPAPTSELRAYLLKLAP